MLLFWLLASGLLLIPITVILVTLLRAQHNSAVTMELIKQNNKARYKQHLSELDYDIESGLLKPDDMEKVKDEFKLSLLHHIDDLKSIKKTVAPQKKPTLTALILLFLLPCFVVSVYLHLGEPELIEKNNIIAELKDANTPEQQLASIEKMLANLEKRMSKRPNDIEGWFMLANSYIALERYDDALTAMENLYRLSNDNPSVILRYADILAISKGGDYSGRVTELINQALMIDPENPSGLWLAGVAANSNGDKQLAIQYWQRLLPKLENNPEQQKQIKQAIELLNKT